MIMVGNDGDCIGFSNCHFSEGYVICCNRGHPRRQQQAKHRKLGLQSPQWNKSSVLMMMMMMMMMMMTMMMSRDDLQHFLNEEK